MVSRYRKDGEHVVDVEMFPDEERAANEAGGVVPDHIVAIQQHELARARLRERIELDRKRRAGSRSV